MNITVHSSDLNWIMKTIVQCTDQKDVSHRANVRVTHIDNKLTFVASNGQFSAEMSIPVMGGDGESFCVDASMFAKVCAIQSGEVSLSADGKACTVKGMGRTRLPVVNANVQDIERIDGCQVRAAAGDFRRCYNAVAYAVATDQSRIQLTGVLLESDGSRMKMAALDGFQLSVEEVPCSGDETKIIVPGGFMKLVAQSMNDAVDMTMTTDDKNLIVETEGAVLRCGLLGGEFVDYRRILPNVFAIQCRVKTDALRNALKAGNVVGDRQNLVRLVIGEEDITVQNNSEQADYEAKVPCMTQGNGLQIAFNQKYLANMINAADGEEVDIGFNGATSPAAIRTESGVRLALPVRVQ